MRQLSLRNPVIALFTFQLLAQGDWSIYGGSIENKSKRLISVNHHHITLECPARKILKEAAKLIVVVDVLIHLFEP